MQNALRFERDSSGQYPINMLEHCEEITKKVHESLVIQMMQKYLAGKIE